MALWHGVLLMVLRGGCSSVAENLQRYAQRGGKTVILLNMAGVLLQVVSAPMDAVAYSVAPQSMLAPVGMVGLLFNLVAAQRVHGDALSRRDIGATALVVAGTVTCLLTGAASDDGAAAPDTSTMTAYGMILAGIIACLASILFALREVGGWPDALTNAVLGGLIGSTTVVASKVISAALSAPEANAISIVLSFVPIAIAAPTHLYVLNRGFGRHSLVFMSPVGGAAGLLANVATGFTLYGEVPEYPAQFGAGVALLCAGVLSFCAYKPAASAGREELKGH
mmetsp:Transcript_61052/g.145462  ORF Transcript_61052/g.145462 Transcript_61052/m.145462 type:complete len:281 (+) Transcript_61052:101-943(+)